MKRLIQLSTLMIAALLPLPPGPPGAAAQPATPAARPATPAPPGTPATPPAARPVDPRAAAKAKAVALLKQGNRKLDEGLYYEALTFFKKAYSIYPSPKLHFNIAQAYNRLKRFLEALRHYELFVKGFKPAENKRMWDLAHKRIFNLQAKIATIQFQVSVAGAEVTVDGRPIGKTPITKPMRFMPGPHAVIVTKTGFVEQAIKVKLKPGQHLIKRIKLLTEAEDLAKRKEVKRMQEEKRAAQERLRAERDAARKGALTRKRAFRISGWTGLGTGVALAVVGAIMGIMSGVEAKKVEDADPESYWKNIKVHYDRCTTYRNAAYYTLGFGAAMAVAGGVLLGISYRRLPASKEQETGSGTRSGKNDRKLVILPTAGPRRAGVTLSWRF